MSSIFYLLHICFYLKDKPPIEELRYFLEYQMNRVWAPIKDNNPARQRKEPVCPSLQFSMMGKKLYVGQEQVRDFIFKIKDRCNGQCSITRTYIDFWKLSFALHLYDISKSKLLEESYSRGKTAYISERKKNRNRNKISNNLMKSICYIIAFALLTSSTCSLIDLKLNALLTRPTPIYLGLKALLLLLLL
jgi:hypothetical protein